MTHSLEARVENSSVSDFSYRLSPVCTFSITTPESPTEPTRVSVDFALLPIRRSEELTALADQVAGSLRAQEQPNLEAWADTLSDDVARAND